MTDIRSHIPTQSWRNRNDWTCPDCKIPSDIQGEQPRIPCPPLTITAGSKLVEPTFFWYFAHLTLKLAFNILLQLLPKEREELLAPHNSLPELTPAFVHTAVCISMLSEEHKHRAQSPHLQCCYWSVRVFKGERNTTGQMLRCYITDCRKNANNSWMRPWLSLLTALSPSTGCSTVLADRILSNGSKRQITFVQ